MLHKPRAHTPVTAPECKPIRTDSSDVPGPSFSSNFRVSSWVRTTQSRATRAMATAWSRLYSGKPATATAKRKQGIMHEHQILSSALFQSECREQLTIAIAHCFNFEHTSSLDNLVVRMVQSFKEHKAVFGARSDVTKVRRGIPRSLPDSSSVRCSKYYLHLRRLSFRRPRRKTTKI